MAGASDKARFFLEQTIPELHELRKKKLFTEDEIASIARKRSDFEHKINARGSKPSDFTRYADYEINLDSLKRKRAKRHGVKGGAYSGQKRIFFVLERGTRKFHGDLALWLRRLEYSRQQKAFKKVSQIITDLVRLHPTKPEVWIFAASCSIEDHGDMTEARSYMQQGLRFCKSSEKLWLEYFKLELLYIAKIAGRRKILGLDEHSTPETIEMATDDPNADAIALPSLTAEDIDPSLRQKRAVDQERLLSLSDTPALSGAIPIAIFDNAMTQFKESRVGCQFFELATSFHSIPCVGKLSQHIIDFLVKLDPLDIDVENCYIRQPMIGVDAMGPDFPAALGVALDRLTFASRDRPSLGLAAKSMDWILPYLQHGLDEDVQIVLRALFMRSFNQYKTIHSQRGGGSDDKFAELVEKASDADFKGIVAPMLRWGRNAWPENDRLKVLEAMQENQLVAQ